MLRELTARIPGARRALHSVRRLRNRVCHGALILLYHRVADPPSDPYGLAVSPPHFADHLEVLRRHAYPMPLHDLVHGLRNGTLRSDAVALTMDDGYADLRLNAKPLLERYDIPATMYVTTGCIDRQAAFWWDELACLLLQPTVLPSHLRLTSGGRSFEWDLGTEPYVYAPAAPGARRWTIYDPPTHRREQTFCAVMGLLRTASEDGQTGLLADLRAWSGAVARERAEYRTLTLNELREIAADGLVAVGAHTVSHPVLAALSAQAQRDEIAQSKDRLEAWLSRPVTTFAYPYGSPEFFTRVSVAAVRAAGFTSACAVDDRHVRRSADPYQLSRVMVHGEWNWDGDQFARWLREAG